MKVIVKTPTTKNFKFHAIEIDTDEKTVTNAKNFLAADFVVLNKQQLDNLHILLYNLGFKEKGAAQ